MKNRKFAMEESPSVIQMISGKLLVEKSEVTIMSLKACGEVVVLAKCLNFLSITEKSDLSLYSMWSKFSGSDSRVEGKDSGSHVHAP